MNKSTIVFNAKVFRILDESSEHKYYFELPRNLTEALSGIIDLMGVVDHFPFKGVYIPIESKIFITNELYSVKIDMQKDCRIEIINLGETIEPLVPSELQSVLKKSSTAKAEWENTTEKARRDWVYWLVSGKEFSTREKRAATALDKLEKGMGRVCCFGGLNWLLKEPYKKSNFKSK